MLLSHESYCCNCCSDIFWLKMGRHEGVCWERHHPAHGGDKTWEVWLTVRAFVNIQV